MHFSFVGLMMGANTAKCPEAWVFFVADCAQRWPVTTCRGPPQLCLKGSWEEEPLTGRGAQRVPGGCFPHAHIPTSKPQHSLFSWNLSSGKWQKPVLEGKMIEMQGNGRKAALPPI